MSENEKRVPVRVPGPQERDPPPSSSAHRMGEIDQKFKDFSRMLARFPQRPQGDVSKGRRQYADLFDSGREYRVVVEVPSIPKDQLGVTVTGCSIRVDRMTHAEIDESAQKQEYHGRVCSTILRTTLLSDQVDAERAEATLNNGILEVRIPKMVPTGASKHKILAL